METSFIISLGITFVLILLLIYHFKQRLTSTESKQDTMFEIINNLAQELNNIKGHLSLMNRPPTPHPFNTMNNEICFTHENMVQSDDPDKESEEFDYDDEDDEDDEDERIIVSDDEDEDEDEDDISVVELTDNEDEIEIEDINANENIEELKEEEISIEEVPNFSKMNLGSLKAYIVEKGLVEDASKMKKAQILTLIQEQQPAI